MVDASLAPILGRVPSGIFVLTVRHGDDETGMLVSWVQQAGFEPPMITAAVNRQRYIADWLAAGEPFVLNVLRENQRELMRHFSAGFALGESAFDGLDVARAASGLPILTETLGHLECRPAGHVDSGDHRVFLAEVISGRLADTSAPTVHIRKNGFRY